MFIHRYNSTARVSRVVAILSAGDTFSAFAADFVLTVLAIDPAAHTARLSFGSCHRSPPTLTLSQSNFVVQSTLANAAVPMTLTVQSNDANCAPVEYKAALTPQSTTSSTFGCNTVSVVIRPDFNILEMNYFVQNSG